MAIYGYIRVSTEGKGQTTDNQRKLIQDAGFHVNWFFSEDGVSGSKKALTRPEFSKMVSECQSGDTIIVTAVDRLGRSASDILNVVEYLKERNIRIRVMQFDGIDITSSTGKMILTCMAAMAEMERNILIERTNAGLARTKEQGTKLGRPLTVEPATLRAAVAFKSKGRTWEEVASATGVPKNTIHRTVTVWADKLDAYEAEWNARQVQYNATK